MSKVAIDVLERRQEMLDKLGKHCEHIFIPKPAIDQIFLRATHQQEYMVELYKLVIPNWYAVKNVGYPIVSKETHEYIMARAIEFDKKHHPDVMAGGAWMNSGFSRIGGHNLAKWIAVLPNDLVYMDLDTMVEQGEELDV